LWFFPLETNLVLLFVLICQIRPCFKFTPSWTRLQINFEELILYIVYNPIDKCRGFMEVFFKGLIYQFNINRGAKLVNFLV